MTGRAVRREGLDKLEERWRNRKPPRRQGEIPLINDDTPEGQVDGLRQLLADLPDNSRRDEAFRLLEMLGAAAAAPAADSRPETMGSGKTGATSNVDEDEHEREMAALQELMASNNVEAAQEKLDQIIEAAEADGHIDEDEQKQIDDAKRELEEMRQRRAEAEKAIEEAKQKAELVALMAANDVDAAEKKLKEIIAAAQEDGHIDEDEQKQIDDAERELAKLKARKVAMEKKTARMQAAKGGLGFGKEREEKMQVCAVGPVAADARTCVLALVLQRRGCLTTRGASKIQGVWKGGWGCDGVREQGRDAKHFPRALHRVKLTASNGCRQLSAAQRETAAERLRLATELRELKEAHTKMRTQFNKLKHDKAAQDETLAATVVELEGVRESNAALHAQVHEQHIQIRALTQERDELRKELKAQIKLAKARATQIEELAAAMDASNGRWQ